MRRVRISKRKPVLAAVAVVAMLGAACGGGDAGGAEPEAASGEGGGDAVTLTAAEFAWDPDTLTAPAGGSIELVNEDEAEHNLTIDEAGVDEDVDGGQTVTVDLGDVEAGTYDFVCEYHADTMKGTLEVE